jgi:SOS response regulatory protein OraA/RecX
MTDKSKLMRYAIDYLSKFSSSKKNLERILKSKIIRLKIEKKDKPELYNSIPEIILKLESNKFINDENYTSSKIRVIARQGKSKACIKNYLIQKGIEKKEFVDLNPNLLMKAIGGLFHQLLISNDEDLKDNEFEDMLKNFLKPKS